MPNIYDRVGPPKNPPRNQGGATGGGISGVGPPNRGKPDPKEQKSLFRWLLKQLNKSEGATALTLRGLSEAGTGIATGKRDKAKQDLVRNLGRAKDVLTGKEETGFLEQFKETREASGQELTTQDKIFGFGASIFVDPINVFKPIKLARNIGKFTKLDTPAAKLAGKIADTKTFKATRGLVSNKTGGKSFDTFVTKARDILSYRKGEALKDAIKIQKTINSVRGGLKTENLIIDALESKAIRDAITDPAIKNIVSDLSSRYSTFISEAKGAGLKVKEILDYAPRVTVKKGLLSKFRGAGQEFGIPNTGAGRTVKKFVGEDGVELIGTAKFNKLKPFEYLRKDGKVIKQLEPGATPISYVDNTGNKFKPDTFKRSEIRGTDLDKLYENNPAVSFAIRAQAQAKALTSKEFVKGVRKFATKEGGVTVKHSALKGLKFTPEQAKVIDNFYKGIDPEEIKFIAKHFDGVQNIWKAQALMGPSYHIRNFAGNIWNNFLAGVNVFDYETARQLQVASAKATKAGKPLPEMMVNAQKANVVQTGQFVADIPQAVKGKVKGGWKKGINPFSQQFKGYKINQAFGGGIEDNAKLAHFITMQKKGKSVDEAAASVKKFLFDYGDLTSVEQNVFKRALPFYTWTRKNLPLQVEQLIKQPGKFAVPGKVINAIENRDGNEKPNEKFISKYISDNIPVRIKKNKDGDSEYFMLGQWLPYASAIDVLSQPTDTVIGMLSPLFKTIPEIAFNKSTFFKNTLGDMQEIHPRGSSSQAEFLGQSMNKKTIHLLRNIRLLNEINKFIDKKDPRATQQSFQNKVLNLMVGKAATYDKRKAKFFYDRDTQNEERELMASIRDASQAGDTKQAKKIREQLMQFKRDRR